MARLTGGMIPYVCFDKLHACAARHRHLVLAACHIIGLPDLVNDDRLPSVISQLDKCLHPAVERLLIQGSEAPIKLFGITDGTHDLIHTNPAGMRQTLSVQAGDITADETAQAVSPHE